LHVDVDPTPTTIEQVSSDFRDVNGVKFPLQQLKRILTPAGCSKAPQRKV